MLCDAAAMEKTSGCFPRAIKKKSGPNSPGKRTRKKKPEPTTGAEAAGRRKRKHAYFKESQASEQNRVVSSSACVPLLNIPTIQADPHVNFQELAIDHRQISGSNRSGICLVVPEVPSFVLPSVPILHCPDGVSTCMAQDGPKRRYCPNRAKIAANRSRLNGRFVSESKVTFTSYPDVPEVRSGRGSEISCE